jgi:hypothetical protein
VVSKSMDKREFKLRYGSVCIEPLTKDIQCHSESKSISFELDDNKQNPYFDEITMISVRAKRQHDAGYYINLIAVFKALSSKNILVRINKDFIADSDWNEEEIAELSQKYLDICAKHIDNRAYGGELCFYKRQGHYIDYKPIVDAEAIRGIIKLIQSDIGSLSNEALAQYFGYLNTSEK